jgi:uncharacterized protein (TIGR02145 family)
MHLVEMQPVAGDLSKWDGKALIKSIIYENGNLVGIGTNNPSTKLEIGGVITSTGANFTGITTVPEPVNTTDAATKAYVDLLLRKIEYPESLVGVQEPVTDYDGNTYHTIRIGNQVWMAENMKTTKYSNGTEIPLVNTSGAWATLTATDKAYCWYNDDLSDKETYGALYNWAAAMNGEASSDFNPSGVQGICSTGWHLPSSSEWSTLIAYLGGTSIAGGKLKETGTAHWSSPNTGANNESGFTALP